MKCFLFFMLFGLIEYLLFFIITNWISIINYEYASLKYTSFSFSTSKDSPTGLNMILKVFFPPIYIVILSGILYELEHDILVKNIFLVTITYYTIKWIVCIFFLNRRLLMNWKSEFFCATLSSLLSWAVYASFISKTKKIFIPLESLRDGIWMGIITFFFGLIINLIYNQSKLNLSHQKYKIRKYVKKRYSKLKDKYSHLIKTKNKELEKLTYAIMIYESYNRPWIIRWIEYLKLLITGHATLGIMQVSTGKPITDEESVKIGYKIIKNEYFSIKTPDREERLKRVIFFYNKCEKYVEEVMYIYCILNEKN